VLNSSNKTPYVYSLISIISFVFFSGLGIWFVFSQVTINADMQQFLPKKLKNTNVIDPLTVLNAINKSNSGLFLISINGNDAEQRAIASIHLRKKLLKNKNFISVNNGKGLLPKEDRALLKKYRYLLSSKNDKADAFSQAAMTHELQQRYQELRSPLAGIVKKTFNYDPTAEVRFILEQWHQGKQPDKAFGVWSSADNKSALILAAIDIIGADINKQEWAINKIKDDFANIHSIDLTISISGIGVFAVQAREKIKLESRNISIFATMGVLLLIFLAFNSVWIVFLSTLPLTSAILAGVVATQLIFGSVHGITLAFGLTLIGVALDYPIHVFSHLTQNENIKQSIRSIWPTLRLGVLTTCLGFLALTQTSFNGLAQLGVFAISGLLIASLVTWVVLPELLSIFKIKEMGVPSWIGSLSRYKIKFGFNGMLISLVVVGLLFLAYPIKWENDLAKLSPISSEQSSLDKYLREQLKTDDLVNIAIVYGKTSNSVIRKTENLAIFLKELVHSKKIKAYHAPYQFLSSVETQLARQRKLPERSKLEEHVFKAIKDSRFKQNRFSTFINDVAESRKFSPLKKEQLKGTLLGTQLSALLIENDNDWFGIIRFVGVNDSVALEQEIINLNRQDVSYLNIKKISQMIVDDFRNEAVNLAAVGVIVIFIALLIGLNDRRRLIQVCFIVTMAVAFDILLLNIFSQALSLFHLTSLLLVLGLGLDYSLFFTRKAENSAAREKTVYGILVCFGSTALVFGMLAYSSIPVLSAIGVTVFIGVSLSFLFAILFSCN